jgi:hypothetical protein
MGDGIDVIARIVGHLADRVSGPLKFRLILQPLVAGYLAVRAGLQDARVGRPAFLWAIVTTSGEARELLRSGWKDVGKVFLAAVLVDVLYQVVVARWVYPGEALVVAVLLALVPYVVVRGPVTRIMRDRVGRR